MSPQLFPEIKPLARLARNEEEITGKRKEQPALDVLTPVCTLISESRLCSHPNIDASLVDFSTSKFCFAFPCFQGLSKVCSSKGVTVDLGQHLFALFEIRDERPARPDTRSVMIHLEESILESNHGHFLRLHNSDSDSNSI